MSEQPITITLTLDLGPDSGAEEIDTAARRLREELLALDVDSVERARAEAAPDSGLIGKGDPITLGTLLVTLLASGGAVTSLIALVQAWINRGAQRSVKLKIDGKEIELTGISSEEQQRLLEAWLQRLRGKGR